MRSDRVYLLHILECVKKIFDYTSSGKEQFLSDSKTQDAVIRNLEIIGEAVKQLSDGLRDDNPDIPWKQIAGMRDKMIHDYLGVNIRLVWGVVEDELPNLQKKIEGFLLQIRP